MIQSKVDYEQFKDQETTRSRRDRTKTGSTNKSVRKKSISKKSPLKIFSKLGKNKALIYKILFTLLIILIYRGLSSIPLPGVNMEVFERYFGQASASEANYLFLIFTGSTLETPSIVGLGIAAYIQASIMMQLLTPVIPKLAELSKDGARGQQLINQYTRYLTFPLSFIYSAIYLVILSKRDLSATEVGQITNNPDFLISPAAGSDLPTITKILFMATVLTAGSLFLMWLAESINEHGIGNGSSVVISVGILASLPTLITRDLQSLNLNQIITNILAGQTELLTDGPFISFVGVILGFIALIAIIVFINESARKIKIRYARRAVSTPMSEESNLPIKLTITGVLPIIFASALLSVPQLIIPFIKNSVTNTGLQNFFTSLENSFLFATNDLVVNSKDFIYGIVFFLLIVGFGVFYAFISLKPKDVAENLQKRSAFVPGIRPGKATEKYIIYVLARVGFAGALFLGFIALLPLVSRNLIELSTGANLFILSGIGGTSILIVVSVILDTYRQFQALKVSRSYEQYAQ